MPRAGGCGGLPRGEGVPLDMDDPLTITSRVSARDRVALLTVAGEMDLATSPAVAAELERLGQAGLLALVVDLRGLTFIDSSGLRVVARAAERARGTGQRLVVVRGETAVRRAFEIVGLEAEVECVDDPAPVLRALRGPGREDDWDDAGS